MKYLFYILLFLPILLSAQQTPIIFPEDIGPNTVGLRCYCKPGVIGKSKSRGLDISYRYSGNALVEGEDMPLQQPYSVIKNHQAFTFKLKFPVINKPGFKILMGYAYKPEVINFKEIGADFKTQFRHLDGQRLKNNSFSLITVNSFTSSYFSTKLKISSNGDYNNLMSFKKRYLVYNFIAAYGVKKREDLEWGFGVSLSHSFRKNKIIPFVIFNRNFNERWGLEMVLPALVMGRYNVNGKTIVLAGLEFNSKSFSLTSASEPNGAGFVYNYNHSEINGLVRVERHLVPWLWMSAEMGYQFNFSSDFDSPDPEGAPSFMVEPKDNIFFKIGLFISPPDKFFK